MDLNGLNPDDVAVQAMIGRMDGHGELLGVAIVCMEPVGRDPSGNSRFEAILQPSWGSGLHGYAIRVLPRHVDALSPFLPGLITWASVSSAVPELQLR